MNKKPRLRASMTAIGALAALIGTAQAQSSVTAYGVLDLNLRQIRNGDPPAVKAMGQGTVHASRLGFRGDEDLGGGWKASFTIEHGLNPDDGTQTSASQFWNRLAIVGLKSPFGEIRLGHDNTPTYWNLIVFDPFGGGGVGSFLNILSGGAFNTPLLSGAGTLGRSNNGVGYFLPGDLGGVYGQAQITAGEGVVGQKYIGGRLGYRSGPLDVGVVYGATEIANEQKFKQYGIGATYDFGVVKLQGQLVEQTTGMVSSFRVDGGQRAALMGAIIPIAGAHWVALSYDVAKGSGYFSTLKARQLSIGYVHNLSKRTALYAYGAELSNEGGAGYITGPLPAVAAAAVSAAGVVRTSSMAPKDAAGNFIGKKSTGFEFGIRHRF